MEGHTLTAGFAFLFGVLHALEPGHGKTALLTYVASGQKTWKEGVVISVSSALTHSLSVFIIAFASHSVFHLTETNPEDHVHHVGGLLSYISGGVIIILGLWFIYRHFKGFEKKECESCGHKDHHEHNHEHGYVHGKSVEGKKNNYVASGLLGVATGIIPCPTIVVAYLGGVSVGGSLAGIHSVILFAVGMCLSLLGVVTFFSFGGQKLFLKLSKKKFNIRWDLIQGCAFIIIGIITAFYH